MKKKRKARPALWTTTPSGKAYLRRKKKQKHQRKFSAGLLYKGVPLNIPKKIDDQLRVLHEQQPKVAFMSFQRQEQEALARHTFSVKTPPKIIFGVAHGDRRAGMLIRSPIRRETPAHVKARAEYNKRREAFLKRNPYCVCCPVRRPGTVQLWSDDVHHRRGRGKFLLDETTWSAVCRPCHMHIHDNPAWAYQNGFMEKRT